MIGSLCKMIELLEKKQYSLLTTIAVCSLCAAVMLTIGIYKGEVRAEATKAVKSQIVTALEPDMLWADKESGLFPEGETTAGQAAWEFHKAASQVVAARGMLTAQVSAAQLEAADRKILIAARQLEELQDSLRTIMHKEQEASTESKDSSENGVGDSG